MSDIFGIHLKKANILYFVRIIKEADIRWLVATFKISQVHNNFKT